MHSHPELNIIDIAKTNHQLTIIICNHYPLTHLSQILHFRCICTCSPNVGIHGAFGIQSLTITHRFEHQLNNHRFIPLIMLLALQNTTTINNHQHPLALQPQLMHYIHQLKTGAVGTLPPPWGTDRWPGLPRTAGHGETG